MGKTTFASWVTCAGSSSERPQRRRIHHWQHLLTASLFALLALLPRKSLSQTEESTSRARSSSEGTAPPTSPRLLCFRWYGDSEATQPGCHLLVFPLFIPTTLPVSYAGVRVGGAYQWASHSPFLPIGGNFQRGIGSGAVDFSKALVPNRFALVGSLSGDVATGANAGTLLGDGARLGGGLDIGFLIGHEVLSSGRVAISARAMERYGLSLLPVRAFAVVQANPLEQTVQDAAGVVGEAASRIAVPYRETGNRADGMWMWAAKSYLSFQGVVGVERTHRYYRNNYDLASAPDVKRLVLPRLGLATEFDVSAKNCVDNCIPLAFIFEYELSPTRMSTGTLAPSRTGPPVKRRVVEHVLALGFHYASDRHPDIDAGLTAYWHLNVPPEYALTSGAGLAQPKATEIGTQVAARYIW
jgi:hypothetical protein